MRSRGTASDSGYAAPPHDTAELTSTRSAASNPSLLANKMQKRLQKDLAYASSPLGGVDLVSQASPLANTTSSLFVTAPDLVAPPMVPTTNLGDPRNVMRASAKEYADPSALMSRSRKDGLVLTPEQIYVRLLRKEVKLAERATVGAGEVPPLQRSSSPMTGQAEVGSLSGGAPWSASVASSTSAPSAHSDESGKGGKKSKKTAVSVVTAAAGGGGGQRPQQLACEALRSPLDSRTAAAAGKQTKRAVRGKGGVSSSLTVFGGAAEDEAADDDDDGDDDDEADAGQGPAHAAEDADTAINPFSPSAAPKMQAAAEARAVEVAALLSSLDAVHATWAADGAQLSQSLYEKGQFEQNCAREGVAAFAKELGTIQAVATLPPFETVCEHAHALSHDVTAHGTATRRMPLSPAPVLSAEDRSDVSAGNGVETVQAGSAELYKAPWSLLTTLAPDAVPGAVAPRAAVSAQDLEREMHMKLIETKLKYLIDYELQLGQENRRRALRGEGGETYEPAGNS